MGCGASTSSIPPQLKHSTEHIDGHIPNNEMYKKEKTERVERTSKNKIEEKIRSYLSIPEDDIQEALSLVDKHPKLHDEFDLMANIMHQAVQSNPQQFVQQLDHGSAPSPAIDFFAFIGGGKVTVEMYSEHLKSLGVTHVTDEMLDEAEADGTVADVIVPMRDFWVNSTDESSEIVGRLLEANVLSYLTEDIKNLPENFRGDSNVFENSVTVLHNCARVRGNKQYFRDIKAVQLLTPILARKEKEIKLLTLLTLSYIIDEEHNDLLLADDTDFDFLLENIAMAWELPNHRTRDGYSLEELLQGLGNLAQNDENKTLLMKKGALSHLKPIMKDGSDAERQEAVKIVWELAFNRENKSQMVNDGELMELLNKYKTSGHKGVAKSCNGALWVLKMYKRISKEHGGQGDAVTQSRSSTLLPPSPGYGQVAPPAPPQAAPASQKLVPAGLGHIMISYQWGNQKLLLQIRDSLKSCGFKVWMDVDNIAGSTLQAMAEAVEDSVAVLMCMSQRYKDSPNCRTEAEYAFQLQKPIIPLLMEKAYIPDGWLGILKGSKLFFDFSGKYPYEKKMQELVKELERRGLAGDSVDGPIKAEKVATVGGTPVVSVDNWSHKDVLNWLHKHKLNKCQKLQSLSGENVKFLQNLSLRAPEFFFTYLKNDLGLTSLDDLMHFSNAIEKLP